MPLKLSLKPNEKIFIGGAVIQNGANHAEISVLNDSPVLREKDILTEQEADSACRKIYLCIQLMYMDPTHLPVYQINYCKLVEDVVVAAPSTIRFLAEINTELACGRYYQALKHARKLVEYEQELIKNVTQPA
jgi:flagellar biosynthesis repressor protein FlbT